MARLAMLAATVLMTVAALMMVTPTKALAQDDGDSQAEAAPSDSTSVTVAPAGVRRYVAGRWATVAVNANNPTDQDSEEMVTVIIGDEKTIQYARKMWVPANSRRQAWLPVRIPADLRQDELQVKMTSIHLQQSESGEEQFQSNVVGMPTSERSLLLSWEESRTGAMFDPYDPTPKQLWHTKRLDQSVYVGRDAVIAGAQDLGMVHLSKGLLPPSAKALDGLDQIVIADNRVLSDTLAVRRLQSWLQSGGRVWIMVDQVDPDSVRALLGDSVCYSEVDRVELNDFDLEQVAVTTTQQFDLEKWTSEKPVELVRVLVDTDDVHSRIDGWPTAFWQQVGQGEVLFTTLGESGWRNGEEPLHAYRTLASRFFVTRIAPPRPTAKMASFLDDEIGYEIPNRGSIGMILGLHMLLVLVAGAWLASRHALQHLAVVIPVVSLVAAGALVAVGRQKTSAVPSTIATGQIVRAIPDSSEVQVDSVAAIFAQESRDLGIVSSPDTTTRLRQVSSDTEVKRIQWTDRGDYEWLFVKQPPGVIRHVESESIVALPQPWTMTGKFTPQGFQGRLAGLGAATCEDAVVIAAASPSLAIDLDDPASASFTGGTSDVLAPGQFIDATLMSDVQQQRQNLLRDLSDPALAMFQQEPTMFVWTEPVDSGVTFDDDYVRRGAALATVPIRLERLPGGSDFQVPASFVKLEAYVGDRGPSTIFRQYSGEWNEDNKPNQSDLRALLPSVLLPCKLTKATVMIRMNAPSRTLQVMAYINGQFETVFTRDNPSGLIEIEIDRPEALELDDDGGLLLSLTVSATEEELAAAALPPDPTGQRETSGSTWKIDYVHVNLEGTTE